MTIKQSAGRDALGEFAPEFAHFNDDILFGENWNNEDISLKTRSIITIVSLVSQCITDSSLKYHLQNAKNHGVTKKEIAAIITHVAFYAGWPKAWATFNLAKEVFKEETESNEKTKFENQMLFPIGELNEAYAKYFIGKSYLYSVSTKQLCIFNVTFEPGCRNNWHIHHARRGGGQILICMAGIGYYQEWGKEARVLHPGDVVNIPAGVKHWHGASLTSYFSHLAIEVPGEETSNEWLEEVNEETYKKATSSNK